MNCQQCGSKIKSAYKYTGLMVCTNKDCMTYQSSDPVYFRASEEQQEENTQKRKVELAKLSQDVIENFKNERLNLLLADNQPMGTKPGFNFVHWCYILHKIPVIQVARMINNANS